MKIKETKCTCEACGHVWYYGKQEMLDYVGGSLQNAGSSAMCCSGCAPAALIPDKKTIDPTRCPKCGSHASKKEEVIHDV